MMQLATVNKVLGPETYLADINLPVSERQSVYRFLALLLLLLSKNCLLPLPVIAIKHLKHG